MVTISLLNTGNEKEHVKVITTPFGYSCATRNCTDAVSIANANVVGQGPCTSYDFLITVRVINCSSNFSGEQKNE